MIFNLLTPPQCPGGGTQNYSAVARPIYVNDSHTKFVWIASRGLGGKSITDGPTYRPMDRSDITILKSFAFLFLFSKKACG